VKPNNQLKSRRNAGAALEATKPDTGSTAGDAGGLPELIHKAGHILGMNDVTNLFTLVSEDLVLAPFHVAFH
jgi:hypothetical protein